MKFEPINPSDPYEDNVDYGYQAEKSGKRQLLLDLVSQIESLSPVNSRQVDEFRMKRLKNRNEFEVTIRTSTEFYL